MADDLTEFAMGGSDKDLAYRVDYAYKSTQRQYERYPPKANLVPIAGAINAWTLICGVYMGIEQTMKFLVRMNGGTPEKTHDLECLYSSLDPSERDRIAVYYRVYRSLHNFDAGNTDLETVDKFIQHIGKGYKGWRYILVEDTDPEKVPRIHLGSMLETWRALVDLVNFRVSGDPFFRTLAEILEQDYIIGIVCCDAEDDDEWQAASHDENSGVEFKELFDWFKHRRRILEGGLDLFNHHARGTGDSIQASPLLRGVLLRAADKAARGPFPTPRGADIAMFHHRIRTGGLAWDANNGVFK